MNKLQKMIEWISVFCGGEFLHCGTNGGDM